MCVKVKVQPTVQFVHRTFTLPPVVKTLRCCVCQNWKPQAFFFIKSLNSAEHTSHHTNRAYKQNKLLLTNQAVSLVKTFIKHQFLGIIPHCDLCPLVTGSSLTLQGEPYWCNLLLMLDGRYINL